MATAGSVCARKPSALCSGVKSGNRIEARAGGDQQGIFLAVIAPEGMGQVVSWAWILCAVHDQVAMSMVGILTTAALKTTEAGVQCWRNAEGLAFDVQPCVLGSQGSCLADIALEAVAAVRWHAS